MSTRLARLAFVLVLVVPALASADRVRVRVGAHVSVGGHVHVGIPIPRVAVPIPVPVVVAQPVFAEPPPPPVYVGGCGGCCGCGCGGCGTEYVPAEPVYSPPAPAYVPPPPAPVAVVATPRVRRLGVGLQTSSVSVNEGELEGSAVGAFVRFKLGRAELEADFARAVFLDDNAEATRRDTRVGVNLYVPLTRGRLAPYLMGGVGANNVHVPCGDDITQTFLQAGVGGKLELSERLAFTADLRFASFEEAVDEEYLMTPPRSETTAEARLAAILYF